MNWVIEPSSSVQLKKIKRNFDGHGFVSLSAPVYPSGEIIWEMQRYQVLSRLPEKPCETLWRYETLISRPIMWYGSTHARTHTQAQTHAQTVCLHAHARTHTEASTVALESGREDKTKGECDEETLAGRNMLWFYQPVKPSLKTWGDTGTDRTADWKPDPLKQAKERGVWAAGGKHSKKPAARPGENLPSPSMFAQTQQGAAVCKFPPLHAKLHRHALQKKRKRKKEMW